jgi:hypothetical protein
LSKIKSPLRRRQTFRRRHQELKIQLLVSIERAQSRDVSSRFLMTILIDRTHLSLPEYVIVAMLHFHPPIADSDETEQEDHGPAGSALRLSS